MTGRVVIIGRNSAIWQRLQHELTGERWLALGHAEVASARIESTDRVWILSYSRIAAENRALLEALKAKSAARSYHYISTATANVVGVSNCYAYPRAKADAEVSAQRILGAQVVRIGVVYGEEGELPAGCNAATSLRELAEAMRTLTGATPPQINLFRMVMRPFRSALECEAHRLYGRMLSAAGRFPCILRPLDLLLRRIDARWYGYLYLSNKLLLEEGGEPGKF